MAYYEVTAKFEVEADSEEAAQRSAFTLLSQQTDGDFDVLSIKLSADQGVEEN